MSDDITVIFEPEEASMERKKPAMSSPNLYLEYLENKQKVKKEEVGKDYVIDSDDSEDERLPPDPYTQSFEPQDDDTLRDTVNLKEHDPEHDNLKDDPEDDPEHDPEDDNLKDDPEHDPEDDNLKDDPEGDPEDDLKDNLKDEPRRSGTQPSLSELKKDSKIKVRSNDYKYPLEEENEITKKRNKVFFHYEVLKRMHPEAQIPEFTSYSDPDQMEEKYTLLAKKYSLDSSVENWKRYIIVGILGFEIVLGKLNFDMEGFAQHQISSINTYDQLLIEMAEKSYVPTSERWPVEMRLIMMFTMNVVIFLVSKMIMNKTGVNLIGTINKATGISNELRGDHSPSLKDPE